MLIDIVIPYVNYKDNEWYKSYVKYKKECNHSYSTNVNRFRDFGTLRYVFRGIEKNMPFINNVFLILASESQCPEWVDKEKVKIVYHKDFIPEEFLPTFNANTIEMFLWNIKELGEYFIYSNDDFFPLKKSVESDYFRDNKPIIELIKHLPSKGNIWNDELLGSIRLASHNNKIDYILQTRHGFSPMIKSKMIDFYEKNKKEINKSISRFRESYNFTGYLWVYDNYVNKNYVNGNIGEKYLCLNNNINRCVNEILSSKTKCLCLNDNVVRLMPNTEEKLHTAFLRVFPHKSSYELFDYKVKTCKLPIDYTNELNEFLYSKFSNIHVKRDKPKKKNKSNRFIIRRIVQ